MGLRPSYVFAHGGQLWAVAYLPWPADITAATIRIRPPEAGADPGRWTHVGTDWVEVEAPVGSVVAIGPDPPDPARPPTQWLVAADGPRLLNRPPDS